MDDHDRRVNRVKDAISADPSGFTATLYVRRSAEYYLKKMIASTMKNPETFFLDSADAVIVNKTLADLYWPDGSAIGRRFRTSNTDRWARIVGVVGDVYVRRDDQPLRLQMYDYVAFQLPATPLRAPVATLRTTMPVTSPLPVSWI